MIEDRADPMKNEDSLTISIGGISLLLTADDNLLLSKIKKIYSNFITNTTDYSIKIELELKDNTHNLDYLKVTIDEELCTIIGNSFSGEFNLYNHKGKLRYNDCQNAHLNLDNYLRVIYSLILLDEPGFLVHAASLIKNDEGFLFPGKSGTGKTTISSLSSDSIHLSEEVSLVKWVDGNYNVFGTPFGVKKIEGENTHTPLKQILLPKKDQENYIIPSEHIKTLKHLIPNVLFFLDDAKFNIQLFDICNNFVNSISAYELHFLPEPSFWSVINAK